MDLLQQKHEFFVKHVFGASTQLAGSIGSGKAPGEIRIVRAGVTLGSGTSFSRALADVTYRSRQLSGGYRDDSLCTGATVGLRD